MNHTGNETKLSEDIGDKATASIDIQNEIKLKSCYPYRRSVLNDCKLFYYEVQREKALMSPQW